MFAVTGGTGHLGQVILRQLKSRQIPVGVVVRSSSDRSRLEGYCDWIADAPLDDVDALTETFSEISTVIHSAALIDIRSGHRPAMRRVNVDGTKNVIQACRRAGVGRLVYISSIEAIDLSASRRPVREDFGFASGNAVMDYGETKAEASRLVAAAGLSGELETCLLCPTGIIGPWDYRGGLFTSMIRSYLRRRLPALVPGGCDFVDVRDVAGAAIAAGSRGRSGEVYLISGCYREITELLEELEQISGVPRPKTLIPKRLAGLTAGILETWGNAMKRSVPLTHGSLAILNKDVHVDSAKAAEELGFRARPIRETLNDLVTWIRDPSTTSIVPDPAV